MSMSFELRRQDMKAGTLKNRYGENNVEVTEVEWTEPVVIESGDNYSKLKARMKEEVGKIKPEDLYKTVFWITPKPPTR